MQLLNHILLAIVGVHSLLKVWQKQGRRQQRLCTGSEWAVRKSWGLGGQALQYEARIDDPKDTAP